MNESNQRLKILSSNNWGEIISKAFMQYYKDHKSNKQLTIAYTQHQNGITDKMNRDLLEKAKTMTRGKNLP